MLLLFPLSISIKKFGYQQVKLAIICHLPKYKSSKVPASFHQIKLGECLGSGGAEEPTDLNHEDDFISINADHILVSSQVRQTKIMFT